MRAAAKAALVALTIAAPFDAVAQLEKSRDDLPEAIDKCAYDILKKHSAETGSMFSAMSIEAIPGRTATHIESAITERVGVMFGRRVEYTKVEVFNEGKKVTYKDSKPPLGQPEFSGSDDAAMKAQAKDFFERIRACRFKIKPSNGSPARRHG